MYRETAGEISKKLLADNTKYNALEVGHAMSENIEPHLRESIENYKNLINENEFCVVMVVAKDTLLKNIVRRKFYCWPYLPKPRPNQAVFLYNKGLDRITKRLWVLPSDVVMAELHSLPQVDKRYQTMKEWSDAFYHGWQFIKGEKGNSRFYNADPFHFWKKIRQQHTITMPSEHEYFLAHREELIQAGCKVPDSHIPEPFDFSKIAIKQIVDTCDASLDKDGLSSLRQTENPKGSIAR